VRIGIISDTHGLLRPEALKALQGAEHILHAGDVGDPAILDALRAIAPVTAIRGNIDEGGPCNHLPPTELVELDGRSIYMLHDVKRLDLIRRVPASQRLSSGTRISHSWNGDAACCF
jgi:putative phosphoesterase